MLVCLKGVIEFNAMVRRCFTLLNSDCWSSQGYKSFCGPPGGISLSRTTSLHRIKAWGLFSLPNMADGILSCFPVRDIALPVLLLGGRRKVGASTASFISANSAPVVPSKDPRCRARQPRVSRCLKLLDVVGGLKEKSLVAWRY